MNHKIKNIFVIQVLLFIFSIIIVTIISVYLITIKQIESEITSDFRHDLEITTTQFNYKYKISEEQIKAITSRTMIKKELYKWHTEEITLEQIRSFTQSKYADGASVYTSLIYTIRTDLLGNVIATYDHGSTTKYDPTAQVFYKDENGYNLILKNKIIHNNELIGYDTAAFYLGDFTKGKSVLLENTTIMSNSEYNSSIREYYASYPIGDTGYYLYAELSQKALKEKFNNRIISILFQALLIIIAVVIISYFTILKLSFKLVHKLEARTKELTKGYKELEDANSKIKVLSGIIPICSNCKKIRDDEGYWNQLEKFISENSNAQFSHGICDSCVKELYPDFYNKKK